MLNCKLFHTQVGVSVNNKNLCYPTKTLTSYHTCKLEALVCTLFSVTLTQLAWEISLGSTSCKASITSTLSKQTDLSIQHHREQPSHFKINQKTKRLNKAWEQPQHLAPYNKAKQTQNFLTVRVQHYGQWHHLSGTQTFWSTMYECRCFEKADEPTSKPHIFHWCVCLFATCFKFVRFTCKKQSKVGGKHIWLQGRFTPILDVNFRFAWAFLSPNILERLQWRVSLLQ